MRFRVQKIVKYIAVTLFLIFFKDMVFWTKESSAGALIFNNLQINSENIVTKLIKGQIPDEAKPKVQLNRTKEQVDDMYKNRWNRSLIPKQYPLTSFDGTYHLNNENLCSTVKDLLFVVLVHTATDHFENRATIRETWGNFTLYEKHHFRIVFLLGIPRNQDTQANLLTEQEKFHDLVQGNFMDTYYNLSLKAVFGMRWVTEYCPQAKFILKLDDDVFVHTYNTFEYMDSITEGYSKHIWCKLMPGGVNRIRREGKWKVVEDDFKGLKAFPMNSCVGPYVILSNDLPPLLFKASKITPIFWIDDTYMYGLLTDVVGNVTFTTLKTKFSIYMPKNIDTCFVKNRKPCHLLSLFPHPPKVIRNMWNLYLTQLKKHNLTLS